MKKLIVNTSSPYNIIIQRGSLFNVGELVESVLCVERVCIITDSNVSSLYLNVLKESLKNSGFYTSQFIFKAGEQSKNLSTIKDIYTHLSSNHITRSDIIVALGGGVVGDIAGFAAATYLRGINFIQVPTTLLAQIDSSIGGKTGVNIDEGKNLVGAFWQPKLVIIDPNTLISLPKDYFNDGMAEVIKYACIKSASLFKRLSEENIYNIIDGIIFECIDIKRKIVENDERDVGERMLLNFGHTIGHALEKLYNYNGITHGKAVSIGMAMITQASESIGLSSDGCTSKIKMLLKKYDLPYYDKMDKQKIIDVVCSDKKNINGYMNFILIKDISSAYIYKLKNDDIQYLLNGGNTNE